MIAEIDSMPAMGGADVYAMESAEVARFQLAGLRQRFDELQPRLPAVRSLSEECRIAAIDALEDIVPLCLPHTVYKSYSAKDIERGRYDRLTQWLDGLSTEDLSGVDASGCDSLEAWLEAVEAASALRPMVSSGTTGKISFFPRTAGEADIWLRYLAQALAGVGEERDARLGTGEPDWFSALPMATGRQSLPRIFDLIRRHCYGGDGSRIHTLGRGHWDADMLWLSGRMRAAQARGETAEIVVTPALERVRTRTIAMQAAAAENVDAFLHELLVEYRDRPLILFGPTGTLIELAIQCRQRGLKADLSPDAFILTGGGTKGMAFPDGWEGLLHSVFPPPYQEVYGMTECTGVARLCSAGWFHWPPTVVQFVLDPDSGEPLPRTGTQTGRFAIFDLCASTHWGGAVTADRVTLQWHADCACGRRGPRIQNNVTRYSQLRDDDKITCARSPGAYERAVENLIGTAR